MKSYRDVIRAFGGPSEFAAAIGANANTARSWLHRDSVPPEWWVAVVKAARAKRIRGITFEVMAIIAAPANDDQSARAG